MRLIGMLDSPYVRRVAISLKRMGIPFEHESVSVFRHYERFRGINPVVKAPTLVTDDGTVLMDSTLILDYAETLVDASRRLMPAANPARLEALRLIGVALAAVDKCVSIVYEKERREVVDAAWMARITQQANTGFELLERELEPTRPLDAAGIMAACAWRFSQFYDASEVPATRYPRLVAYSQRAESTPEFASTPLD
jgi:glutathione S-transferase